MNKTQKNYMVAKAIYETLIAEKRELLKPYEHLLDSDSGIEEYTDIEMKTVEQLGTIEAAVNLRQAETAMIEWANKTVRASKYFKAEHAQAINTVMNSNSPSVRNRLVELAFRLNNKSA